MVCFLFFLLAAVEYMKSHPVLPVNVAAFEDSCGIGVNITPDQIEDCVSTCTLLTYSIQKCAFNPPIGMGPCSLKVKVTHI